MGSKSSNNSVKKSLGIVGILVSILTSGAAASIVTYLIEKADKDQIELQYKLSILRPARNALVSNQDDYDTLMNRYPGLEHLEYYVDYVRGHFDSRPEYGDTWRFYIGRIWYGNLKIIEQLQWYIDSCDVLTPDLRKMSIDFNRHASLWNTMWERVALSVSGQPLPPIDSITQARLDSIGGEPIGEIFPRGFPEAVEREYSLLMARAGIE